MTIGPVGMTNNYLSIVLQQASEVEAQSHDTGLRNYTSECHDPKIGVMALVLSHQDKST